MDAGVHASSDTSRRRCGPATDPEQVGAWAPFTSDRDLGHPGDHPTMIDGAELDGATVRRADPRRCSSTWGSVAALGPDAHGNRLARPSPHVVGGVGAEGRGRLASVSCRRRHRARRSTDRSHRVVTLNYGWRPARSIRRPARYRGDAPA
jgi:hypothetical protein